MALSYDFLTTTTREIFIPKLIDNIFDESALLKVFLMDKAVKVLGGRKIVEPLKYAKSTAVGVYDNYDTFDLTPPDDITAAEFNWGHYFASVVLAGTDEIQNQGKARVLDLLATRVDGAKMIMRDKLADDFYAGTDTKGIIGLASAVSDTSTSYGGITSTDFSGWVSGEDSTTHTSANMVDTSHASYALTLLAKAFRSCTHLGSKPNAVFTNLFVWDVIERAINAKVSYDKTTSSRSQAIANLGFNVLDFRGVPIVADEKCPDSTMYVLNTNFINIRINPLRNFLFTGFKQPINQDSRVGQILLAIQLTVNNRRMHYKFDDMPTS